MSTDDLQEELKKWFNSTGFPLEIECARAFLRAGFAVENSAVYPDPETRKGREIDVLAYRRDATGCFSSMFAVECKASDKPWVVLTNKNRHTKFGGLWIATLSRMAREAMGPHVIQYLQAYEEILGPSVGGYALKQAFSGKSDQAYTASIGALKAATSVLLDQDTDISFGFPTIVVSTPIYEYSEDSSGKQRFIEVLHSSFELSAYWERHNRAIIRVVSKDYLPEYAERCRELSDRYEQLFAKEIHKLLRRGI